MSLYFDAASVLSADIHARGSLKSRVYSSNLKSAPAQVYALIAETAKWDTVLKEVVDNAGILASEPKLTPLLALFLTHDLLLAKNGLAAKPTHPLRLAIERHRTRLRAEFTKCRVRRGCASVEELRSSLLRSKSPAGVVSLSSSTLAPRWVRINNALTTLDVELRTTFSSYNRVSSLPELSRVAGDAGMGKTAHFYVDRNVPDLLALHPAVDVTAFPAYKSGRLILQDKASCFPGYLLLGDPLQTTWRGDIIDACAAPGNKTTHLLSLLSSSDRNDSESRVFSFDASETRSATLKKMVDVAGVASRTILFPGQDFLSVDPLDPRFRNVTALLLDPSCSGSGIRGREDIPTLALPLDPRTSKPAARQTGGRKRKRNRNTSSKIGDDTPLEDPTAEETPHEEIDMDRLTKLSNLQTRIVEHAFKFPAATRITYSTCSIHEQENEYVVSRVLSSETARRRSWRILPRHDQVEGMKAWRHRGTNTSSDSNCFQLTDVQREACIRAWPDSGDGEGTGGFFVAGFVRDADDTNNGFVGLHAEGGGEEKDDNDDDEESWHGFSD